jgi:tryptophan synthase alpha chain
MKSRGWQSDRPLLICYAPLGDPQCPADVLAIYAEQGVNIVEVGVPTQNPCLDGETVADSMRRALRVTDPLGVIRGNIDAHAEFIRERLQLVLMGYRDMPFKAFTSEVRKGLVHGLIIADTSTGGDSIDLTQWLNLEGVKRVGFVDAGLSSHLIERVRLADGYVMLQAYDGPTGVRTELDGSNAERLRVLRAAGIDLPIALGFGIRTPEQAAAAIRMGADGVVVGSACIEAALRGAAALGRFIAELRAAVDHESMLTAAR